MVFWGIEVKPAQIVKVNPGEGYYLHISQVALGETEWKGNEDIQIFLKYNGQKLVIGTLSPDKCSQIQYDLVVEKEFELSHTSMNKSIYFCGYKTLTEEDDGEGFDDVFDHCESDEEEDIELSQKANGIPELKPKQAKPAKKDALSDKPKPKPKKDDKQNVESHEEDDSDDEDADSSSDDFDEDTTSHDDSSSDDFDENTTSVDDLDEEMDELDSDDDEDDDSEDESDDDVDSEDESDDVDEATPVKVEHSKKRSASASKTPVPEKKAKLVSSLDNQKTGHSGKKVAHTATLHPAKQGGKGRSSQQSPKSAGSISCNSCSKTFASDNALKAHAKVKHGDGK